MPNSKKIRDAVYQETQTPPDTLSSTQCIARLKQATGNNLYLLQLANGEDILAELESKFRSTIWIKRGSFVLVDSSGLAGRENKLAGVIINVVTNEREWRKMSFWPSEFKKRRSNYDDDSDEEGPKMPSSDSEDN